MDSALRHFKHAKKDVARGAKHVVKAFNAHANKNPYLTYGIAAAGVLSTKFVYDFVTSKPKGTSLDDYPIKDEGEDVYDVIVCGAGPSGSTLGYFLAREGHSVVLLEKKTFPRDKFCGDAVATIAQNYLREMGVLKEIVDEDKGHFAQNGGFVSPAGNSFIGNSAKEMRRVAKYNQGAVIAIKRIVLDEKIANAAKRMGADLREEHNVLDAQFNKSSGVWTITVEVTEKNQEGDEVKRQIFLKSRAFVCADGSPSKLARHLGIVKTEPNGVCSRSYVKNNTLFKWDGVVFYPPKLLPGYCAIIREARGELNYLTYIIPGGPAKDEDLHRLHHEFMEHDPFISKSLGPEPDIERMKAASLRLGGVDKSYGEHLLVIGDAAGFIDPLTGEGIQYAMDGGKIAADVLIEGFRERNLSAPFLKKYQDRWMSAFGREFWWSMKMSLFLYRFPIFLDAACRLIQRRGARFLAEWASVMTGLQSKTWFLRWDVGPFIVLEAFGEVWRRILGRKPNH
eukprot:TRINITY_DN5786_c0_g1_i6.p1 TRINITY_DN5786_c0_g1~~TRINITY_DN5786_c0_g1_i6.p1  ORF type:complete len:509 (-),score=117.32 TRINITY_DN5786_c0_g1_i6:114-1640(-)